MDRYDLRELIGEGVSAKVYRAVDMATGSVVAVKVLNPQLQTDALSLQRFRREIQITRLLKHPQIVSIFDLLQSDGHICLVMEYLDGHTLKDFSALHAPLPVDTVVSILTQVLRILAVCHRHNVIHRDLKPQNIMVDSQCIVRLLDFGIAKMTALSDLTQTGTAIGTPDYMAPELFAKAAYDPRTDLYALGAIAFEALAGHPPFRGDSLAILYHQHLTVPIPALRALRADVPDWLQQVVERLLAKNAYERYQSASEALTDIERRHVIAREIPTLKKSECVRCGGQTIAELPLCVRCGYSAAAAGGGDVDVLCTPGEETEKLSQWVHAVFGLQGPVRRGRRTLLFAALDPVAAQLITHSAQRHHLSLSARPHPPWTELRKATALAFMSLVIGGLWQAVSTSLLAWRRDFELLSNLQFLQLALGLVLCGVCLRRVLAVEVLPLLSLRDDRSQRLRRTYDWLADLAPMLQANRTEAMQACVSRMLEKYLLLSRCEREIDAVMQPALRQCLQRAAELACVVSEVEKLLSQPRMVARSQRYAHAADASDPQGTPSDTLGGEVAAYYAIEERYSALVNTLISMQAVFNRLLGQVLVFRLPIDDESRGALDGCAHDLEREVLVSREVQQELARLV